MLMTLKDLSICKASVVPAITLPHCQKHAEEQLKLIVKIVKCKVLVCFDCFLVQCKSHDYGFR